MNNLIDFDIFIKENILEDNTLSMSDYEELFSSEFINTDDLNEQKIPDEEAY